MRSAHPELGAVGPVGADLGGGDVAPVAVQPLAHVDVEVHAARQVSLVLQQPHLRSQRKPSQGLRQGLLGLGGSATCWCPPKPLCRHADEGCPGLSSSRIAVTAAVLVGPAQAGA